MRSTSNPSTISRLEAVARLVGCIKGGWNRLFSLAFSTIVSESIISHILVCWNFSHTKICLLQWIVFFKKATLRTTSRSYSNSAQAYLATTFHTHTRNIKQLQNICSFFVMSCCVFSLILLCLFFIREAVLCRVTGGRDKEERPSTGNAGHSRMCLPSLIGGQLFTQQGSSKSISCTSQMTIFS